MFRIALSSAFAALGLAACAEFPQLDATVTENMRRADFPQLAPISELRAQPKTRLNESTAAGLAARVASLRARAARLQGSVVGAETKRRMKTQVTLPSNS